MKKYLIKKVFGPNIMGEGSLSGLGVIFVRFAGCNRWDSRKETKKYSVCKFCDTDFSGGERLTAFEIVQKIEELKGNVSTIVLSGGEPTLQIDDHLILEIKSKGYQLALETNGSKPLGILANYFEHISMSPKQSFEETKLEWCNDIKILLPPISPEITTDKFSRFPCSRKYVQPVFGHDYQENLEQCISHVKNNRDWKLSLQIHKILGEE